MTAALLSAFALVYLGFPTRDLYFDGLTFAMAAEGVGGGGDPAWLFHPHHLLYSPLAFLAWKACWTAGLTVRAWLVMTWLSTGCAIAGLWAFHRLLRDLKVGPSAAIAGAACLGSTWGWWHFGTNGDTTMPEALLLLLLLRATLGNRPWEPGRAVRLGLLQGFAILIHQTAVLFAPAACAGLWTAGGRRARTRAAGSFLAGAAGVAVAGYAAVSLLGLGHRSPGEFLRWAAGYLGADPRTGYAPAYGGWAWTNLPAALAGWGASFLGPGAWIGVVAVLLAAAGAVRALGSAGIPRPFRAAAGIWLATHAAFFLWWKPGHARFWTLALPAWIALAVAGWTTIGRRRTRWASAGAAAATAFAVGLGPFRHELVPAANPFFPVAEAIGAAVPEDGTVVLSGVGTWTALKAYVPYVARRRMLVLDWQFSDKAVPPQTALLALRLKLGEMARRGPLYLLSEVLAPALDDHFRLVHGVPAESRRALFAGFRRDRPLGLLPGLDLVRLR